MVPDQPQKVENLHFGCFHFGDPEQEPLLNKNFEIEVCQVKGSHQSLHSRGMAGHLMLSKAKLF